MLCPNSTNQLKSLAMSASQSFNLQGHRRFAGANFAPFGSVEKTTLAGKHLPYFGKLPTSRRESVILPAVPVRR
jgi:hypothetical protein